MLTVLFFIGLLGTFIMFHSIFSNTTYHGYSCSKITAQHQRKKTILALISGLLSSAIWAYLMSKGPDITMPTKLVLAPFTNDIAVAIAPLVSVATWCFTILWVLIAAIDTKKYRAAKKQWAS